MKIIKYKPLMVIGVVLGFGLLMLISGWFWQFGLVLSIIAGLTFILVKDYEVCRVYDDHLVISTTQQTINFSDIVSYQMGGAEAFVEVLIKSEDEFPNRVVIRTFNARQLQKTLYKIIPNQDASQVRFRQLQENRLSKKEIEERRKK